MRSVRIALLTTLALTLAVPAAAAAGTGGGTAAAAGGGTAPSSTATGAAEATTGSTGASGGSKPTGRAPALKPRRRTSVPRRRPGPRRPTSPVPQTVPAGPGAADIPAAYLRLYQAAGRTYSVDWRILAAIGKNESDHGRSTSPGVASGLNYARCCAGPMQFCTVKSCGNTWDAYGVDGNGDGTVSVYDPADAIPGAAKLVAELARLVGPGTDLILASYNAGPAYAMAHGRVPPYPETQRYVANGLAYIRGL